MPHEKRQVVGRHFVQPEAFARDRCDRRSRVEVKVPRNLTEVEIAYNSVFNTGCAQSRARRRPLTGIADDEHLAVPALGKEMMERGWDG